MHYMNEWSNFWTKRKLNRCRNRLICFSANWLCDYLAYTERNAMAPENEYNEIAQRAYKIWRNFFFGCIVEIWKIAQTVFNFPIKCSVCVHCAYTLVEFCFSLHLLSWKSWQVRVVVFFFFSTIYPYASFASQFLPIIHKNMFCIVISVLGFRFRHFVAVKEWKMSIRPVLPGKCFNFYFDVGKKWFFFCAFCVYGNVEKQMQKMKYANEWIDWTEREKSRRDDFARYKLPTTCFTVRICSWIVNRRRFFFLFMLFCMQNRPKKYNYLIAGVIICRSQRFIHFWKIGHFEFRMENPIFNPQANLKLILR